MDNVICTTCCIYICCNFKMHSSFLMHSYAFVCSCLHLSNMIFISWITYLSIFIKYEVQDDVVAFGSKIYCAFVFAPHKGPSCMPNTFVHISFGFHFKNKISFLIV